MAKILIVDDERITVEMLSTALDLQGHQPLTAYNGEQALGKISEDPPDLILLDWMMPGLDGYQTLKRLRKMPQGARIPVIVVTASEEKDLEQRVRAAGGDGLLRKPINMDMVKAVITEHIEHG
jgi:CheY-like chemotaxis protein